MVAQHFRWDFIGLSTDNKPTPATSSRVVDGSTFYCADNSKLYVYCGDQWYEKEATGGGGGTTYTAGDGIAIADNTISVDLAQTTGTDTKKVMSQDATTGMLFKDKSTKNQVQIGNSSDASGLQGTAVGSSSTASGTAGVALGGSCQATAQNSVAFAQGQATTQGEFNVGTSYNWSSGGYKDTAYRVIRGVHDGEQDHDAITVGQINNLIDAINTATGSNISHIGS